MKKVIKYSKVKKYSGGGTLNTMYPNKPKYAQPNNGLPVVQDGIGEPNNPTINQDSIIGKSSITSNIPTNAAPSEMDAAMSGASMGSAAGPVGAVIGLVGGVLMNQKKQKDADKEQNLLLNQKFQEQKAQDSQVYNDYNKKGNFVEYYAKGGKLAKANSSTLTTGKYHTTGGGLKPISDNAQEVVGNKHGETTIDNTSGVKLIDKDSGVPEAEVEDGEVLIDEAFVYSDRLKMDKKNTFADIAKKLANKRQKITNHVEKFNDSKTNAGAQRQLAGLDIAEESLFNNQERVKAMQDKNNKPMMYANGGNIDPNKGKLATRKDSMSVANSSKNTAAYYRKLGYKEVIEKDPEKLVNSMKFLDEQANRFKKEGRANTIIQGETRDKKIIDSNLYRQNIDANKFNQRETANAILNLDAPVTQYDRRIQPTSISKFTAPDGLYKDDLVSVPSYADLFDGKKTIPKVRKQEVSVPVAIKKPETVIYPDKVIEARNKIYDTDFVAKSRNIVSTLPKNINKEGDLATKRATLARDRKLSVSKYARGGKLDEGEGNTGEFFKNLAPSLIDNIGNAILTSNTPKLAKPLLNRAEQLKTTINVNPQLAEITDTTEAVNTNILSNTSNSNIARANISANRLSALKEKNSIYANKENTETGLYNANQQNKQALNNSNTALMNNYQDALRERSNDIQGKISANIGNLSSDIGNAQDMVAQKDYYDQIVALDAMNDKTGEKGRTYSRIPSLKKNQKLQATLKAEADRKGIKNTKTYNFDPYNLRN